MGKAITSNQNKLYVIILWYHPSQVMIDYAINLSCWLPIIVIDNSTVNNKQKIAKSNIMYVGCNENTGVARGYNLGFEIVIDDAKKNKVEDPWCVIFDQDSKIDNDYIVRLQNIIQCQDAKTALIAPIYFDLHQNRKAPIIVVKKFGIDFIHPQKKASASYAISSGSVLRLSCLDEIGLYDEHLFIDFVDIEWGFRAKNKGYNIFILPELIMKHEIGEKPISIFGRKIVNHSPLRHYYYFRNALLISRYSYIPNIWICRELIKLPIRFIIYALFTNCRMQHVKYMILGLLHGITKKHGKLYRDEYK